MSVSRVPSWDVLIDWDNDGAFTGTSEDVTDDVAATPPPSVQIGSDQLRERTPPMIGTARFDLLNFDQDYSAEFAGSPIFGLMLPGRAIEIRATFGDPLAYDEPLHAYDEPGISYDGPTPRTLFTGVIDEPAQNPGPQRKTVTINCFSSISKLRGQRISTPLYESITTGTAVGHILDAVGWPAGKRAIDTGQTTLLYWWLGDGDAFQALVDLLTVEGAGAKLYESGDGVIHFEDRNYRATAARSTSSQVTFDESAADTVYHVAPMRYTPGFRDIINDVRIEATRRSVASTAVIWTYGQTITLGASEAVTLIAKLTNPAKNIVCTNGTDVTASAGSISSVSLNRTSGSVIEITITAGAGGATVNLARLQGDAVTVAATYQIASQVDLSESQNRYGVRSLTISTLTDIDPNVAQDLADATANRYSEPLAQVELTLKNVNSDHLYQQLFRNVSDRVTIVESHTGIDHDYYIEKISHSILDGGNLLVTTFGCSKVTQTADDLYFYDDAAAVYDTALYGS